MRLKRWISLLVLVAMMSSFAGWPTAAVAEMAEHERESLTLGLDHSDDSGKPPCQHGCSGHFSQHFKWQPSATLNLPQGLASEAVLPSIPVLHSSQTTTPPFRPPRPSPIQS